MKVIDLLNKIANREELPERIKVAAKEFYICRKNTIDGDYDYQDDNATYLFDYLTEWDYVSNYLLKDVEVLEEDKEYEDIKEADEVRKEEYIEFANDYEVKNDLVINRRLINALIRNQKKIIEELKNK
jgi:hypothetical protein